MAAPQLSVSASAGHIPPMEPALRVGARDDLRLKRKSLRSRHSRNLSSASLLDSAALRHKFNSSVSGNYSRGESPRAGEDGEPLSWSLFVAKMSQQAALWDALGMARKGEGLPCHMDDVKVIASNASEYLAGDELATCIVCPLMSSFGLDERKWTRQVARYFGPAIGEAVEERVQKEFFGEMTASASLLIRTASAKKKHKTGQAHYCLFVCLGSSLPRDFAPNYGYTALRSALVTLDQHNQRILDHRAGTQHPLVDDSDVLIRSVACPFFPIAGPVANLSHCDREMARQMVLALNAMPIFVYENRESAASQEWAVLSTTDQIGRRNAQSILSDEDHEHAMKEGLMQVLEHGAPHDIVGRGLSSKAEVLRLVQLAGLNSSEGRAKTKRKAFAAVCMMIRHSSWDRVGLGLRRGDVIEAVFQEVDVYLRLQTVDPERYLDQVKCITEIEMDSTLGRGGTSVVKRGVWKGQKVAVKLFHDDVDEIAFRKEVAAAALLEHERIIHTLAFGHTMERGYLLPYIVMPLMENGSLFDLLHEQKKRLDMHTAVVIATQIADAVSYLHERSLIHRDLKSANVLLDKDMAVMLTDFGTSRITSSFMTNHVGTLAWMAPEILEGTKYSTKADVYSFGLILYELFTGLEPFHDCRSFNIPLEVVKGTRPNLPKNLPKQQSRLIKSCWAASPAKRPTMPKALKQLRDM